MEEDSRRGKEAESGGDRPREKGDGKTDQL